MALFAAKIYGAMLLASLAVVSVGALSVTGPFGRWNRSNVLPRTRIIPTGPIGGRGGDIPRFPGGFPGVPETPRTLDEKAVDDLKKKSCPSHFRPGGKHMITIHCAQCGATYQTWKCCCSDGCDPCN